MNRTVLAVLVGLVLLGGLGYGVYHVYSKDRELRELYGRVSPVALVNFKTEVEDVKDRMPVLIYLHKGDEVPRQSEIVARFAWDYAGEVKVVSVNLERPENLLFLVRFGVLRQPGFVALYGDRVERGYDGTVSEYRDLARLVQRVCTE